MFMPSILYVLNFYADLNPSCHRKHMSILHNYILYERVLHVYLTLLQIEIFFHKNCM